MAEEQMENGLSEKKKSCENCGAALKYQPGTEHIKCEYCGFQAYIEATRNSFEELELQHYLKVTGEHAYTNTISILHCKNCGANQHVEENFKSLSCVYCGEPLIREDMAREGWILPGAVLPFKLEATEARKRFSNWVKRLWFAPNQLKKAALDPEGLHGLYLPYWTFDAQVSANYSGQRGDYYYENRRIRTKNGVRNQRVRKTRWRPASGHVQGFVDDVLINASRNRSAEIPARVGQWNLKELKSFDSDFLSGFVTEKYSISLKEGHHRSFAEVKSITHNWIRRDIGGDTQRIHNTDIRLSEETFKHILLPVYISSYRYKDKEYNFYINGQTGVVFGQRPYATWKIVLLVLLIVLVVGFIVVLNK